MMRYILAIFLTVLSLQVWAEGASAEDLVLSQAPIDRSDMASIKRGATFFASNCMACHSLVYLRYDNVAIDAGITYEKMPINVTTWPLGIKPPDLSLEASVRGVDWIYTYLHSFYQDKSRPTGANNLLVPNTAMSGILAPYQGDQVLANNVAKVGILYNDTHWYDLLVWLSKVV